jgi:hypothetical protein
MGEGTCKQTGDVMVTELRALLMVQQYSHVNQQFILIRVIKLGLIIFKNDKKIYAEIFNCSKTSVVVSSLRQLHINIGTNKVSRCYTWLPFQHECVRSEDVRVIVYKDEAIALMVVPEGSALSAGSKPHAIGHNQQQRR